MPRMERSGAYCFTIARLSVRPSVPPPVCLHKLTVVTRLIFGMKAHLIGTHLLAPRSRSSIKGQSQISGSCFSKNWWFGGISVSLTHLVMNTGSCYD